jgi:hypothetical protein
MKIDQLIFRLHAIERMFERGISAEAVHQILETGEVIENYPEDYPYPSCLVLGWHKNRPLHIVAAINTAGHETIVITAYEPNLEEWEDGFKRRRS